MQTKLCNADTCSLSELYVSSALDALNEKLTKPVFVPPAADLDALLVTAKAPEAEA